MVNIEVSIPIERYNDLLEEETILEVMYTLGVDTWEKYPQVLQALKELGESSGKV